MANLRFSIESCELVVAIPNEDDTGQTQIKEVITSASINCNIKTEGNGLEHAENVKKNDDEVYIASLYLDEIQAVVPAK